MTRLKRFLPSKFVNVIQNPNIYFYEYVYDDDVLWIQTNKNIHYKEDGFSL